MPKRRALKLLRFRSTTPPDPKDPQVLALPMVVTWPDGRVEYVYSKEGHSAN